MNKRWGHISLSADGTVDGAMVMGYRTGNFETSETGWTDYTVDLTVENKNTDFFPNMSSKKVQYKLSDFSGKSFKVTDFVIGQPQYQGNR